MNEESEEEKVGNKVDKIKIEGHRILKKRHSIDIALCSVLINIGKLAFPTYIYICYTNLIPKKSYEGMIVATISIIVVLIITSYLENIRQNILKKEKQIMLTEEGTNDGISYLADKIKKSDVEKLLVLNASKRIAKVSSYDLIVVAVDIIFSLAISSVIINIGGGLILLCVIALRISTNRRAIISQYKNYDQNYRSEKIKYEKMVKYSRIAEGINSLRLNNFQQKEIEQYEKMQLSASITKYNDNVAKGLTKNFESFVSKLDVIIVASIGTVLVISEWMTVAKLGACLLLITRCTQPWSNFLQIYAQHNYKRKLKSRSTRKLSDESKKTNKENSCLEKILSEEEISLTETNSNGQLLKFSIGKIYSLKDQKYGENVNRMCELIFEGKSSSMILNNKKLNDIDVETITKYIKMVDLSSPLLETNLLDALSCLNGSESTRQSLYLTYLCGLAEKIKKLEAGYESEIHNDSVQGLNVDDMLAIKVIQSLATIPKILIIEMRNVIFGREFVIYIEKILEAVSGKVTILINTNGGIIDSKTDGVINIMCEGDL